jgi:hypothetical protein
MLFAGIEDNGNFVMDERNGRGDNNDDDDDEFLVAGF